MAADEGLNGGPSPFHTEKYPNRLRATPLDYFQPDNDVAEGAITVPVIYGSTTVVTLGMSISHNIFNKRPLLSGLPRHAFAVAAGVVFGHYILQYRRERHSTRDAMIRHYIELHPEDFPPYERKQYKYKFDPWIPIR